MPSMGEVLHASVKTTGAERTAAQLSNVGEQMDDLGKNRRGRVTITVNDREVTQATTKVKALDTQLAGLQGTAQKLQGLKLGGQGLVRLLGIPAAVSAVGPLVGGINALAGGAVALVAPLQQATSLIAGIPGVILPAAGAFGTYKLATLGVGDAIKETVKLSGELGDALASGDSDAIDKAKEKIDKLTASMEDKFAPAALNFISLMPQMQVEAQELGKQLQPGLFSGATKGLMDLRTMVREIVPELGMISGAMGDAARSLGTRITGADFVADMKANMLGAVTLISTLSDAVGSLLSDFVHLGAEAQPVLARVEGTVMRIVGAVSNWADGMTDSKFERGYEVFQQFWQILRNTWTALSGILRAFQPLGDWLWDTLSRLTLAWTRWTNSITGQNSLKKWADSSKPVLEELGGLLGDLGDLWVKVANPEGMGDGIALLREQLVPALEKLFTAANQTGIFESFLMALGQLAGIVGVLAGPNGVLTTLLDSFTAIATMVNNLITSFPALGSVVSNLATAFGLMHIIGVKSPIGMGVAALVVLSQELFGSMKPLVPVVLAFAAAWATFKVSQIVADMGKLSPALRLSSIALINLGEGWAAMKASASSALSGILGAINPVTIAVGVLLAAIAAGFLVWQAWQTNVRRTRDELESLRKTMADGGVIASDALDDYNQNLLDTRDGWKEASDAVGLNAKKISDMIESTGAEFERAQAASDGFAASSINAGDVAKWLALSATIIGIPAAYAMAWDAATNDVNRYFEELENSSKKSVQNFGRNMRAALEDGTLSEDQANKLRDMLSESSAAYTELKSVLNADADAFKSVRSEMAAADVAALRSAQTTAAQTGNLDDLQLIVSRLAAKYPTLADELGIMTDAGLGANAMFEEQTSAMNKAKEELDRYYEGLGKIVAQRDLITAEDDLIKKSFDLTEALKENKGEWDRNTEAGLAHRDAIREIEQAVLDQADAFMAAGGGVDAAKGKWNDFVTVIEALQKDGLIPANQTAEEFLATLGLTEGVWTAEVELKWKDEAYKDLQLLESLVNAGGGEGAAKNFQIAVTALMTGDLAKFENAIALGKWAAMDPEGTVTVNFTGSDADVQQMINSLAAQGISKGQSLEETAWYLGVGLDVPVPPGYSSILEYLKAQVGTGEVELPTSTVPPTQENMTFAQRAAQEALAGKELSFTSTIEAPKDPDMSSPAWQETYRKISERYRTEHPAEAKVTIKSPEQAEVDAAVAGIVPPVIGIEASFTTANEQVNAWRPPVPDTKVRPQAGFSDANRQVNEWRPPVPDTKMRPQVSFADANKQVNEWVPPRVTITPVVGGLSAAMREAIDGLPKYVINIEGKVTAQSLGGIMVGNGYPIQSRAMGGLPKQAKIQSPRANLVQWAEPETHGEAFIPLAPSKRNRSVAIWHETGKRLGVMADGGINDTVYSQWSPMNFKDMKWTPPVDPTGGVGGAGGAGGSFAKIIEFLRAQGIPFRNMGTWAFRNVAGTNRLSLHATGRAVDLGDPEGKSDSPALLRIYRALKNGMRLTELIYSGPGGSNPKNPITARNHHNHVHAAMADGGITAFAKGGLVTKPTLGLLGEAGPELVVPLANGGITAYPGGTGPSTMDVVSIFSSGEVQAALSGLEKILSATGQWTNFLSSLQRSNPAQAVDKIEAQWAQSSKYLNAVGNQHRLAPVANNGFSSDNGLAQYAEAVKNEFELRVATLTKVDPNAAIAELTRAMQVQGIAKWSDAWVSMTQRIEALQVQVAMKQASKVQNKWEWEFEHAEASRQVAMARAAASTMEEWTDEWVAMMRRIEDAEERAAAPTGPAVLINEATFNDQADLDALNNSIEWAIRTARL